MIIKDNFNKIILPNGLTVLHYHMTSVMSAQAVLYIKTGGVYEKDKELGISHFTEHIPFLGTEKHPSTLILSQEVENLGATYNGHTNRHNTYYWINLPYTNIEKGLDILHQLVFEPLLKNKDISKERKVVLSELKDFWHNPDRRFYYEDWKRRFKTKNHPYSRLVLGTPTTINSFTQKNVVDWRSKHYHPSNMLLSVAGNFNESKLLEYVGNTFGKEETGIKNKTLTLKNVNYSKHNLYLKKEKRPQIRLIVSFPVFGLKEVPRKQSLQILLLNNIIGKGMASRLFQRLREKERLVYSVNSNITFYPWMGTLHINGSTDVKNVVKVIKIIKEEIDKLIKSGITKKELSLAKNYVNVRTLMQFDSPRSIAYFFGGQELDYGEIWFPSDYAKEDNKTKINDLHKLAREIFNYSKVNISLMGNVPKSDLEEINKVFKN